MAIRKDEARAKILEFIKSSKTPVNKQQILDATGFKGDYKYAMKVLQKENEELMVTGTRSNAVYSWSEKKALYSEMQNHEGYPDGTAGKAIANVMKSSNGGKYPMRQKFGEVWSTSNVTDDMEGLLVISAKEGTVICYNVYPQKKSFMRDDYTLRWSDDTGKHYISTINPVNIQERRLGKKLYELGTAEKECLQKSLLEALSISAPAKEVTKIVKVKDTEAEKKIKELSLAASEANTRIQEVLAENEKLKEELNSKPVIEFQSRTDPKDIELAVLKAKCEIYERLVFGSDKISQKLQAV